MVGIVQRPKLSGGNNLFEVNDAVYFKRPLLKELLRWEWQINDLGAQWRADKPPSHAEAEQCTAS